MSAPFAALVCNPFNSGTLYQPTTITIDPAGNLTFPAGTSFTFGGTGVFTSATGFSWASAGHTLMSLSVDSLLTILAPTSPGQTLVVQTGNSNAGSAAIYASSSGNYALDLAGSTNANTPSQLRFVNNAYNAVLGNLYMDSTLALLNHTTALYFQINGGTYMILQGSKIAIASGVSLQLGSAYTAGAPAATGYVTVIDNGGTVRKLLCA